MGFKRVLLLLLLLTLAVAVVDARKETVNESFLLTELSVCDGPVTVRVNSDYPVSKSELFIEKCKQEDYNIWKCHCDKGDDGFDINIRIFNVSDNVYDFWVHHYIYYDESWVNESSRVPSFEEQKLGKFERLDRFNNIYVRERELAPKNFVLSPSFQKVLLAIVLVVIVILIVFVYKSSDGRGKVSSDSSNNDMFNYVSKEDDFEELMKRFK
jgi:hypothetical protein